jgi:hypothetical protein
MPITFEEARQLVIEHLNTQNGQHLMVAKWGGENDEWWDIPVGMPELLRDFNKEYLIIGMPAYIVNKTTGLVREYHPWIDDDIAALSFRNYGDVPEMFDYEADNDEE